MSGRPRAVDVRGFVGIRLPRGPVESEDIPRQGQASFRRRRPSSGGSWRRSQRRAKSRSTAAPGAKHRLPAGARSPRRGPRQAHGPPARQPPTMGADTKRPTSVREQYEKLLKAPKPVMRIDGRVQASNRLYSKHRKTLEQTARRKPGSDKKGTDHTCDLGVLTCCGAFTLLMRLVSISLP